MGYTVATRWLGYASSLVSGLLFGAVFGCVLNGCGGQVADEPLDALEVGRVGQGLIFAPAGATQPGMKPSTFTSCFQGDTMQNCVVPNRKDFVYFFAAGTASEKSVYGGVISQIRDALIAQGMESCSSNGCWHFREATNVNDPDITVRIVINSSWTVSACAGSAGKARQLYCYDGATRALIKDPSAGLSGTYHTWAGVASLAFDEGEIAGNLLLSSAQRMNRRRQIVALAVLGYGGLGAVVIGNGRCLNEDLLSVNTSCAISASDSCRMNGFGDDADGGDADHISIVGANCGT